MAADLSEPLSILGYPSTNCVPTHSSLKVPLAWYRKGETPSDFPNISMAAAIMVTRVKSCRTGFVASGLGLILRRCSEPQGKDRAARPPRSRRAAPPFGNCLHR